MEVCTVLGETEALVCDVALGRVLRALEEAAPGAIDLEPVAGQGRRVRCRGAAGRGRFRELVEEAIAAARAIPDG